MDTLTLFGERLRDFVVIIPMDSKAVRSFGIQAESHSSMLCLQTLEDVGCMYCVSVVLHCMFRSCFRFNVELASVRKTMQAVATKELFNDTRKMGMNSE